MTTSDLDPDALEAAQEIAKRHLWCRGWPSVRDCLRITGRCDCIDEACDDARAATREEPNG